MERIAFVIGEQYLYWSSIILALAAVGGAFLFLSLYLGKGGNALAGFVVLPLAVLLSLLLSRLLHWYCHPANYVNIHAAMTDLARGGFVLLGAFAGCFLAALMTRLLRLHRNLPQMLDCMCLAGGAGIAVGRLSSFFNAANRGQLVENLRALPWVYPITNRVSGALEYRFATFLIQAMVTGGIVAILLVFYLLSRKKLRKDGDTALLFALFYSAAQVVLDSTRYDSIYFRSNGFVSIVQVVSAVALGAVLVIFSARMVKQRGFRRWYLTLWAAMAALIGLAGYMEYHVQRHGNQAVFAYSVMSGSLALVLLLGLITYFRGRKSDIQ